MSGSAGLIDASGPAMFARFAYPPNALGLCGPGDAPSLLEAGADGSDVAELRQLAKGFHGAWPYLTLIAAANRISDALDRRVVEAYWIGNELLGAVSTRRLGNNIDERFRSRAQWPQFAEVLQQAEHPHHNFHVFKVYPWIGLLRRGYAAEPLRVIDRCRIRWGRVESVLGDQAVVSSHPIVWDEGRIGLGAEPIREEATWRHRGYSATPAPQVGDTVALHWNWICQRLTPTQATTLAKETHRQLRAVMADPLG